MDIHHTHHHGCEHHHAHSHEGHHHHHHHESKTALSLYFVGIILTILALILPLSPMFKQVLFTLSLFISGYHVMFEGIEDTVEKTKIRHRLTPNAHVLMTLAAIGTVLLGEALEGAVLIFIFAGVHFLEDYVEGKSRREITNLMSLSPKKAKRLNENYQLEEVLVEDLHIGDYIQVANGEQIPIDGMIIKGISSIDESTINGESMPREKQVGDTVYGATINLDAPLVIQVTKKYSQTVFAKIVQVVSQAQQNVPKIATKIDRYEPVYVNFVIGIFILLLLFGSMLFGWSRDVLFNRSLVFLVSASPCALAVSVVPATLSAISSLARAKTLFKGGNYLYQLKEVQAIAFDKTGTLTQGKPQVVNYEMQSRDGFTSEDFVQLAVSMEAQVNHPLAQAIVTRFSDVARLEDMEIKNEVGIGVKGFYQGNEFLIAKPSHFTALDTFWQEKVTKNEKAGCTVVLFAINQEVIGYFALQDLPKEQSAKVIAQLRKQNIKSIMITGDAQLTAQSIADKLKIDEVISNVLPEDKAAIVQKLQQKYDFVAMVGDGVNDAPALAKADIGIAMGQGSDIAIETADMILMQDELPNITQAIQVSHRLEKITNQNMIFAMLSVLCLIGLTFFGHLSVLVSVTLHEGSTMLVLLNSLRLLKLRKE